MTAGDAPLTSTIPPLFVIAAIFASASDCSTRLKAREHIQRDYQVEARARCDLGGLGHDVHFLGADAGRHLRLHRDGPGLDVGRAGG